MSDKVQPAVKIELPYTGITQITLSGHGVSITFTTRNTPEKPENAKGLEVTSAFVTIEDGDETIGYPAMKGIVEQTVNNMGLTSMAFEDVFEIALVEIGVY